MSTNPRLKRLTPKEDKEYRIEKDMYLSIEERELTRDFLMKRMNPNTLLLLVILETGCRPQEALNLLKTDLIGTDKIHVTGLKGSNNRDLQVPKDLYRALEALTPDTEGFLFKIQYRQLVRVWELYRQVKKPLKAMRHSFAVDLYARTLNIMLVKTALGHRSITSTMVYAHIVDFDKQYREAMKL